MMFWGIAFRSALVSVPVDCRVTRSAKTYASSCPPLQNRPARSGLLQHAAKFPDVLYFFDPEHFIDQTRAVCFTQDGLDQVAAFLNHLFASHRIFRCTAHRRDVVGEDRSVVERDL